MKLLCKIQKKFSHYDENIKVNKIGWMNLFIIAPYFFMWFWILGTLTGGINFIYNNHHLSMALATLYFGNIHSPLSNKQLAIFTSLILIGNVISVIPVAILIDLFKIKLVINSFMLINIFTLLALLLSYQDYDSACIFAFMYGISGGICAVPFLKIAFQWFEPKKIALPISIYIGMGLLGGILVNLIFSKITLIKFSNFGKFGPLLPYSFINSGGFALLLPILIMIILLIISYFFIIEKHKLIKKHYVGLPRCGTNLIKVLGKPQNLSIPLIIGIMNIPVSVLAWSSHTYFFTFYKSNISANTGNEIISCMLIGNLLGCFFMGYISDYFGKRKPLLIITNLILFISSSLLLISTLDSISLYIIFFIIGFFCSAQNIGYSMLTEQNRPELVSTENSIGSIVLLSAGAITQNIFSTIHEDNPHSKINSAPFLMVLLIPLFLLIPLLLSLFITDTGPKNKNKKAIKTLISVYDYKTAFKNFNWISFK